MLAVDVVYDATRVWFPGWPVVGGGVAMALAGAALLRHSRRSAPTATAARWIGTVLAVTGPACALLLGGGLYAQHARLRSALRVGDYIAVEGLVYDRPAGARGDAGESWVVESGETAHWYRYERSRLGAGYRRAGPGDGGLRDGDRVRIADVKGRIARLEVAR